VCRRRHVATCRRHFQLSAGDDGATAEDTAEDIDDANNSDNSRVYAGDAAKAKAEADKEVGRGDAEVSD